MVGDVQIVIQLPYGSLAKMFFIAPMPRFSPMARADGNTGLSYNNSMYSVYPHSSYSETGLVVVMIDD